MPRNTQVRLARYGIMQILMHLLSTPLSPRAQRLIGLIWSLYLPSGELAVQHEFTKVPSLTSKALPSEHVRVCVRERL